MSLVAKNTWWRVLTAINSTTRLASLLPELAHKIALRSFASQTHQDPGGLHSVGTDSATAAVPFAVRVRLQRGGRRRFQAVFSWRPRVRTSTRSKRQEQQTT